MTWPPAGSPPRLAVESASCEKQELGVLECGRVQAVRPRLHPVDSDILEARLGREQAQLADGETSGPEIEGLFGAILVAELRDFVKDSGAHVEFLVRLEPPDREIGGERGDRDSPAWTNGLRDPSDDPGIVVATEQAEATLAETDHRFELAVESQITYVENLEGCEEVTFGGARLGHRDEGLGEVDAVNFDPTARQRKRMAAGTTAHVEHTRARIHRERVDQERDFLLGALRERHYPTGIRRPVGLSQVVRDRVEPR